MRHPVNLHPMDPARHRWYVAGVVLTIIVVMAVWVLTIKQTISPEISRIRDGFISGIENAADSIKQIQIDK